MNYNSFYQFCRDMFTSGLPFLVEGAPGIGKTAVIEDAAFDLDMDVLVMETACRSPIDFGGVPAQTQPAQGKKGAKWDFVPIGDLRRLCEATRPTVFFLDDIGQGTTATQNATSHIIHARRVGEHPISKHVRVCAATNLAQHKAGVNPMMEHLKSRFATIVSLDPDTDGWLNWAFNCHDVGLPCMTEPMPKVLPAFISWKRDSMLYNFQPKPGLENSRSPRTVHHVGQLLASGAVNDDNAFELISRAADKGFAVEFLAFLKLWAHLPDPDDVLADPDIIDGMMFDQHKWDEATNTVKAVGQAPISQRPDVAFALVTAASEIVVPDLMENYVHLMEKFNQKPIEVMGMLALKSNPRSGLLQTAAFVNWAAKNKDYMM